jgi:hypothetical protein
MVHNVAIVCATSKMFCCGSFLGPCNAKDPKSSIATRNRNGNKFIHNLQKSLGGYKQERGALCVFNLTLEPRHHELRGVLDAGPGSLLHLRDAPLHHRL